MNPDDIEIVERTQIDVMSDMIGDGTHANPFRPRVFDSHIVGENMSYVRGDRGVVVCRVEVDTAQASQYDVDSRYLVITKDVRGERTEKDGLITLTELRKLVTYLDVQGVTAEAIATKLGVRVVDLEAALVGKTRDTIIRVVMAVADSTRAMPELDETR